MKIIKVFLLVKIMLDKSNNIFKVYLPLRGTVPQSKIEHGSYVHYLKIIKIVLKNNASILK